MKELYFTVDSVDDVAANMLEEVAGIVRIRHIDFVPDKSALLVVDMQRCFLSVRMPCEVCIL